jgi:phosphatidylserine/phosphatidylglycerophosphate/cardiolipin synthase-like enzyme
MQLLVQPEDGIEPILKAIKQARKSIDMHIFRLDRKRIEKELEQAVGRGVAVRTLIAHTNRGGEKALRRLEQRLLRIGATVARTADDLVRYHGKIMIVDRERLYVLGYNLTRVDIEKSRSFGIATKKRDLVEEALKLFEADFDRKAYRPGTRFLLVSPVNSREGLTAFIKRASRALLIYGAVTDTAMVRLLREKARAGVEVRILGKLAKSHELTAEKYPGKRLHVRAIVRDGRAAFVGSQSLRKLELDGRREIGVVVKDARVVKRIVEVFESDWAQTKAAEKKSQPGAKAEGDKDHDALEGAEAGAA